MKSLVRAFGALVCSVAALAAAAPARADAAFPGGQPVRIVVPFPPGGTTDILAREIAVALATRWGNVVVENKAGASGTIFSEQLARMQPDGHTLMLTATHHVINPGLYKNLRCDTRTAFTPIAQIASVPNVLVVNPALPVRSVQELISYAKERPGKVNFGSSGTGGANHLSGELFKAMTGTDMVHVPYKGAAPALNDLLGGQIPVMFDSLPGVIQQIKAGRLRAVGVTSLQRSPAAPDIPTLDESGVKGFEATAWFGLYAPGKMAPDLANRISSDVLEALRSPQIRARFAEQGADPGTMTQPQFAAFVDAEMDKWGKVIATANVKID
jgi:tripartite-type tricarboxylate transporter receptor subunit TctC